VPRRRSTVSRPSLDRLLPSPLPSSRPLRSGWELASCNRAASFSHGRPTISTPRTPHRHRRLPRPFVPPPLFELPICPSIYCSRVPPTLAVLFWLSHHHSALPYDTQTPLAPRGVLVAPLRTSLESSFL
jgi:hypothetical protein